MTERSGYLHPSYAESLAELGTPQRLAASDGWILKRPIKGFPLDDGMGCYPLFCCGNWSALHADLEDLTGEIVCLSLVTDPFGDYTPSYLRHCFRDVVVPYKEHFTVDLSRPMQSYVAKHHSSEAKKAFRTLQVERCANPEQHLDEWHELYGRLVRRHNIRGILQFSRPIFRRQLDVPGLVAFRAINDGETIGMLLWYRQGEAAYYHLGAFDDRGYKLGASFALFWFAIEYFTAEGLKWLDLGSVPGVRADATNGLRRFKHGWSNGTRMAYFCGRIFNPTEYARIAQAHDADDGSYFPIYRKGEFS